MQKNSRTSIESILVIEQVFADLKFSWEQEMMRLALAAYYRQGGTEFPAPECSRIAKVRGTYYAYIGNKAGKLAVYRIRGERSFARQARSWPKAIATPGDRENFTSSTLAVSVDHFLLSLSETKH
ncbi:hypothetical protein FV232_16265 [Methylobacterium sp. WL30]|uniref:hypothetical protein n=1 Tax=unclassified Methylobacterium TaxID=2615210 RepID=UPI0011C952C2|nr:MULTISPECIES: hypothetical protein [unclassified Methylobacterium]TXN40547.1 hypothetical protein FV225_05795 [Methylobacterium sp. WL93]TXN49644.1 hypothetical protein FV227_15555 [Methylobacterium sp. WL119]TXN66147.1 hypothetical protein FV232_16265 [Methylobacterium sp. WL30]